MLTRRGFLTYAGLGTFSLLRSPAALGARFPLARRGGARPFFEPLKPNRTDSLVLPKGFSYSLVATTGDPLGSSGPYGPESLGSCCDFVAYFPSDPAGSGKSSSEGRLWVNHEYALPLFDSGFTGEGKKTREQIQSEKLAVGGSVIHVKKTQGGWRCVTNEKNQRYTALYPKIPMTGPAATEVEVTTGTLANCAGGVTPWNTVLSCEENYQDMNVPQKFGWATYSDTGIDEKEYGWTVEIDPFGELPPRKHSLLGRFAHEGCTVAIGATKRLVIYMGDDANDQFFYKFVSEKAHDPKSPRAEQRKLLESGTLYVADFGAGRWIPLDLEKSPSLKEAGFKNMGELLINTRRAATVVKATPLDRPEGAAIHPKDGSLYLALTNNELHGDFHGRVLRIVEQGQDPEALQFQYEIFIAGGAASGLSCPDNLTFDRHGNLWVSCDISGKSMGKGAYETFGNNGIFFVPTAGRSLGEAFQFASGPIDAELTGTCFHPSGRTLFFSVQHPGERSLPGKFTSHWPRGGTTPPCSAVVAVDGLT